MMMVFKMDMDIGKCEKQTYEKKSRQGNTFMSVKKNYHLSYTTIKITVNTRELIHVIQYL